MLCASAGFCALLPANALNGIAGLFHLSISQAEHALSYFVLGYGLGPLVHGPLANYWGRRKTLLAGYGFALLAGVLSILAIALHQFPLLIIARLGEGLGSSVGLVIGMLMLSDTTTATASRRYFSYIMLAFAFAPSLAMGLSGYLVFYLGAASIFYLTAALMLFWFLVSLSLKETQTSERMPLQLGKSLLHYTHLFKQPNFVVWALVTSVGSVAMYLFNGLAPQLAHHLFLITPTRFGALSFIPSIGLLLGALLNAQLAHRASSTCLSLVGLSLVLLTGIFILLGLMMHHPHLMALMLPSVLLFAGASMIISNASMTAIASAHEPAMASAMTSAMPLTLSAVGINSLVLIHSIQVLPLALMAMGILGVLLLTLKHAFAPAQGKAS